MMERAICLWAWSMSDPLQVTFPREAVLQDNTVLARRPAAMTLTTPTARGSSSGRFTRGSLNPSIAQLSGRAKAKHQVSTRERGCLGWRTVCLRRFRDCHAERFGRG